ncbi:MAG: histidine phosphatase family protein [Acidimicrobiales bacterium]
MIVLIRHGRTDANAAGRLLGRLDPPLDRVGEAQARELAAVVGPVSRVVSSPLLRARQTAALLAPGVEVDVDERWIELDYGGLDGTAMAEVPADTWARWQADPAHVPAGGESLVDVGTRVRAACEELATEAAASDMAVVTHVSPIKAAVAWALGVGDEVAWRLYVAPASITRIGVSARGPVLDSFNGR